MHKTISCGSDNSYGIKADDLFVLDKHELTSSFVAISYEAICNSLGTETLKGLNNISFSHSFENDVLDAVESLGDSPNGFIIKSSPLCSNSNTSFYAGIPSSIICEKKEMLMQKMSEFCKSIFIRTKTDVKTGIIIQHLVKADLRGVMFLDKSSQSTYIEFNEGNTRDIVSGKAVQCSCMTLRNEFFFHEIAEKDKYGEIMDRMVILAWDLVSIKEPSLSGLLDFEFASCNGQIFFFRVRPVTREIELFDKFPFPPIMPNFYAPCFDFDIGLSFIKQVLSHFAFPEIVFEKETRGKEIFFVAHVSQLKMLYNDLFEKARDPEFVRYFCKSFVNFFNLELKLISNVSAKDKEAVIKAYQGFRFRFYLMESLHHALFKGSVFIFKQKYDREFCRKNAHIFYPDENFLLSRVMSGKINNLSFDREKLKQDLIDYKIQIPEKHKVNESDREITESKDIMQLRDSIKPLLEVKDKVDYFYSAITSLYNKKIMLGTKVPHGYDMNKQMGKPPEEIISFLKKSIDGNLDLLQKKDFKKEKNIVQEPLVFPLKGISATPGTAEGPAVIVRDYTDLAALARVSDKSIMISEFPSPHLLPGMIKAAGIVSEFGGMLSHAAILSRELGKPCLVSCKGLLASVKEGDIVRIELNKLVLVRKNETPMIETKKSSC